MYVLFHELLTPMFQNPGDVTFLTHSILTLPRYAQAMWVVYINKTESIYKYVAKRTGEGDHIRHRDNNANVINPDSTLQWRHNEPDSVSDHQPHGCLLNRLFRRRSQKTSKLRVTGLSAWNSPVTGEFPAKGQ